MNGGSGAGSGSGGWPAPGVRLCLDDGSELSADRIVITTGGHDLDRLLGAGWSGAGAVAHLLGLSLTLPNPGLRRPLKIHSGDPLGVMNITLSPDGTLIHVSSGFGYPGRAGPGARPPRRGSRRCGPSPNGPSPACFRGSGGPTASSTCTTCASASVPPPRTGFPSSARRRATPGGSWWPRGRMRAVWCRHRRSPCWSRICSTELPAARASRWQATGPVYRTSQTGRPVHQSDDVTWQALPSTGAPCKDRVIVEQRDGVPRPPGSPDPLAGPGSMRRGTDRRRRR